MATKRRRPGSPKGQPKPAKRVLDPNFPGRLQEAIDDRPGLTVPQLSRDVGCTRAVIWKYLNGGSKTIEAILLFTLADALKVSARWLLTGAGAKVRDAVLTEEETQVLETFGKLVQNGISAKTTKKPDHGRLN